MLIINGRVYSRAGQVEGSTSRAALDTQGKGEGSKVSETTVGVMLQEPV